HRDGPKEVSATHKAGNFAVHPSVGNPKQFSVTHVPSGLSLKSTDKKEAVALANHMHEHAGDAGSGGQFGKAPDKEATAKLSHAFKSFLHKSMTESDL